MGRGGDPGNLRGVRDMKLMHGDCLERMQEIESGSVDLILTDING